jgi:hypothetical protein
MTILWWFIIGLGVANVFNYVVMKVPTTDEKILTSRRRFEEHGQLSGLVIFGVVTIFWPFALIALITHALGLK